MIPVVPRDLWDIKIPGVPGIIYLPSVHSRGGISLWSLGSLGSPGTTGISTSLVSLGSPGIRGLLTSLCSLVSLRVRRTSDHNR